MQTMVITGCYVMKMEMRPECGGDDDDDFQHVQEPSATLPAALNGCVGGARVCMMCM